MMAMLRPNAADQRLIPSAGIKGPVPVLIAIMVFVMMIVAAAGLALANTAQVVSQGIDHRFTIQIADGVAKAPDAIAAAKRAKGVTGVRQVPEQDLRRTLERWLGPAAAKADLPLPAVIDVDLAAGADAGAVRKAVEQAVPGARFIAHRDTLAPLLNALTILGWLALGLVLLIAAASAAAVVLAARGALDTHRATVEVMHGLGATDDQVAQLFQRQIAVDALTGAIMGALVAAIILVLFVGSARFVSTLAGGAPLGWQDAIILGILPIAAALIAMLVARRAVLGALRERL